MSMFPINFKGDGVGAARLWNTYTTVLIPSITMGEGHKILNERNQ